ncbi:hypothetical protein OA530_00630 [Pelagibacteraceae bacterium]|nr:hypothetical protein [Pelagibacteraceae bacterium]
MNYLIIRNDGVGDLILSTPLINRIKSNDNKAKIYLICSNRNLSFAKLYRENKYIHDFVLFDLNKSKLVNFVYIYKKLGNVYFNGIYVLKASNINFFLSCILRSSIKKYIVYKNKSKRGNFRYTPPLTLINKTNYELIDCTNDYKNDVNTHMSDHFINLYGYDNKNYSKKYYLPEVSELGTLSNSINFLSDSSRVVIFHIDEKWNKIKNSSIIIKKILEYLEIQSNIKILITSGLEKYIYIDKVKSEFYKENKFYYFNNMDLKSLIDLTSKTSLLITCHGALTHISSHFNTPLIDLIDIEREHFYFKWKPKCKLSKQIDYNDVKEILETADYYLNC